jgi:hypothetical protein
MKIHFFIAQLDLDRQITPSAPPPSHQYRQNSASGRRPQLSGPNVF